MAGTQVKEVSGLPDPVDLKSPQLLVSVDTKTNKTKIKIA